MATQLPLRTITIQEGDGTESQVQVPVSFDTSEAETVPIEQQLREVTIKEGGGTTSTVLVPITPAKSTEDTFLERQISQIDEGTGEISKIAVETNPVTLSVTRVAPALLTARGDSVLERAISRIDEGDTARVVEVVSRTNDAKKAAIDLEVAGVVSLFDVTVPRTEEIRLLEKVAQGILLLEKDPYSVEAANIIAELASAQRWDLANQIFTRTIDVRNLEEVTKQASPELVSAAKKLNFSDYAAVLLINSPLNILTESQKISRSQLLKEMARGESLKTPLQKRIEDTLSEALTFGKIETSTFNRDQMFERYDTLLSEVEKIYSEGVVQALEDGFEVTETLEEYTQKVIPSRSEYVEGIIAAAPTLKALAKEGIIATVPIYGTIHMWDRSPNWLKAVNIASDLVVLIPILGQAAYAAKAGQSLRSTLVHLAVAEITAPITAIRHPVRTIRSIIDPIETLLDPRKLPLQVLEARAGTIRIPAYPEAVQKLPGYKARNLVTRSEDLIAEFDPRDVIAARNALTDQAISGHSPHTILGRTEITTQAPVFQKVLGEAAMSNMPDLRNALVGMKVGEISMPGGRRPQLYVAPGRMEQYVQRTAGGLTSLPLSQKAKIAVSLGELPKNNIKGTLIIRDPKILAELEHSGKLWRGAAEIEKRAPLGLDIPKPSQILYTRSPVTGEKTALLIIGKPLTQVEIAKLKLLAPLETMRSIFSRRAGSADIIPGAKLPSRPRSTVLIEDKRGILLVRGKRDKVFITPGGGIDKEMSARIAAQRELVEELGVNAKSLKEFGFFEGSGSPTDWRGRTQEHNLFKAELSGTPRPSAEIAEIAYWKPGSNLPLSVDTEAILTRYYGTSTDKISNSAMKATRADVLYDEAALAFREADTSVEVRTATLLEEQGDTLLEEAMSIMSDVSSDVSRIKNPYSPIALYTGNQNITRALGELSGDPGGYRPLFPSTGLGDLPIISAGVSKVPVSEVSGVRPGAGALQESLLPPPVSMGLSVEEVPFRPPPAGLSGDDFISGEPLLSPPPSGEPRLPAVLSELGIGDIPVKPKDPGKARISLGGPEPKKKREEIRKVVRGYTWLQGRVYVSVRQPYAEKDIAYNFRKPNDTVMVRGPIQAWDSIQHDGFDIDVDSLDEWAEWFTASPETDRRLAKASGENSMSFIRNFREFKEGFSEGFKGEAPKPTRDGEKRMATSLDEFAEFDELQEQVPITRAPRRRPARVEVEVVPVSPRRVVTAPGTGAIVRRAPRVRQGGFSWPMGNVYIGIYPPFTEDDITYDVTSPVGTVSVRGPREAWNRIKKRGFEPDASTYDDWAAWFTAKGETVGIEGAILGNVGSALEVQEGGLKAFEPAVDRFFNPKNVEF